MAAEVGALRVSLSLDSAAFTAGTRQATASANVAAAGIATSFRTASTSVVTSMSAMGTAMSTQLRAGMMQQVSALRTGLLSLVSPIGLIVGAASYGLTALIGRQTEASEAARIHADAVKALGDAMDETRGRSSDYIQNRIDETARDLEGAQAALQLARARIAAAETAAAGIDIGRINIWDGEGGRGLDAIVELDRAREALGGVSQAVVDLQTQLNALRGQQRRSWFLETILGQDLGDRPSSTDPAAAVVSKLSDAQRSILDKMREFEDAQTELVRQGEERRRALRETAISSVASIFGSLAKIVGDGSERAFKISKAFALAEAGINTAQAVTKALAGPFPFITAAAVAASGAAQMAAIARSRPGSATTAPVGSAPSGAMAGSGGAAAPPGQQITIRGLDRGSLFSGDSVRELSEKLVEYQRNGGRVVFA